MPLSRKAYKYTISDLEVMAAHGNLLGVLEIECPIGKHTNSGPCPPRLEPRSSSCRWTSHRLPWQASRMNDLAACLTIGCPRRQGTPTNTPMCR